MNVFQRLFGSPHQEGAGPRRRGNVRLEIFSLLAVLLVGALAIGATSASAEEAGATDDQATQAASSGGTGDGVSDSEQGIFVEAVEAGPVDAEFEACMREQGIELPGPSLDERTEPDGETGPSLESMPVDEAFAEAAEQCGHPMEMFTHEVGGDVPTVTAEEVDAFDECLRNAGVDLPEAGVAPPELEAAGGDMAMHLVIGSSDPDEQAAFEQCAELLPEGVVTVEPAATN